MKKYFILVFSIVIVQCVFSQKMMTRSGEIKFEASMPSFEEIAATNKSASCIFDQKTGEFVVLGLVKEFKFKVPLMEEHFNENYIESSKFPKASFKGKVANYDATKITSTKTTYDLEGDLTLHGVTKKVKTKIYLFLKDGKVVATSNFNVKAKDYSIAIPSLVKNKIAEDIKIGINFLLETKK